MAKINFSQSHQSFLPKKNYAPRVALFMSDAADNTHVQVYSDVIIQHNA